MKNYIHGKTTIHKDKDILYTIYYIQYCANQSFSFNDIKKGYHIAEQNLYNTQFPLFITALVSIKEHLSIN